MDVIGDIAADARDIILFLAIAVLRLSRLFERKMQLSAYVDSGMNHNDSKSFAIAPHHLSRLSLRWGCDVSLCRPIVRKASLLTYQNYARFVRGGYLIDLCQ